MCPSRSIDLSTCVPQCICHIPFYQPATVELDDVPAKFRETPIPEVFYEALHCEDLSGFAFNQCDRVEPINTATSIVGWSSGILTPSALYDYYDRRTSIRGGT